MRSGKKLWIMSMAAALLLSGCTGGGKTAEDVPELLEPVAVAENTIVVERRDFYSANTIDVTVVPATEELSFSMDGEILSIKAVEGQMVKKGQTLATVDQSALLDSIKELQADITYTETMYEYERYQADLDIQIAEEKLDKLEKEYDEQEKAKAEKEAAEKKAAEEAAIKTASGATDSPFMQSMIRIVLTSGDSPVIMLNQFVDPETGEQGDNSDNSNIPGNDDQDGAGNGENSEPNDDESSEAGDEDESSSEISGGESSEDSETSDANSSNAGGESSAGPDQESSGESDDNSSENRQESSSREENSGAPEQESSDNGNEESSRCDEESSQIRQEESSGDTEESSQLQEQQSQGAEITKYDIKQAQLAVEKAELAYEQIVENYEQELAQKKVELQSLMNKVGEDTIEAPYAGRIVAINYEVGDTVRENTTVMMIADESVKMLRGSKYSNSTLSKAQNLDVVIDGVAYDVEYIPYDEDEYLKASMNKEVLPSLFNFEAGDDVSYGESGTVRIYKEYSKNTLVVPSTCVKSDDMGYYVYKFEDGQRVKTYVSVGIKTASYAEILEGLNEGDEVYGLE